MVHGRRQRLRWWQLYSFAMTRGLGPGLASLRFDAPRLANMSAGVTVGNATCRRRLHCGSVGRLVNGRLGTTHEIGLPGRQERTSVLGGFGPQVDASEKKLADAAQPFVP
jgi:hypothetical protein